MIERLPYELTNGVTATREGLICEHPSDGWLRIALGAMPTRMPFQSISTWSDAAERLRYREGEPWVNLVGGNGIYCGTAYVRSSPEGVVLHRLAAILCDDAESFRVLHWCVENLKGDNDGSEQ